MEIFKIKPEDKGKVFIVRPLPNAKGMKNGKQEHILSYKSYFSDFQQKWKYRFLCYALINDKLEIFDFSHEIHKCFIDLNDNNKFLNISNMLMLDSNRALQITVDTKQGFLNNSYLILENDKYQWDNTPEKRKYIEDLLLNTTLDLNEALQISQESVIKYLSKNYENH